MIDKEHYDFSCWIIKYGTVSILGKSYQTDCLKSSDGLVVPLLWNHCHDSQDFVLGSAVLEARDEGIYAYCTLFDTPHTKMLVELIQDRGSVSLSPYVNNVKIDNKHITGGVIKEVSLTLARIDPDEAYYPVMKRDSK